MYGKLIDGKLVYAPDNYVDADGNLTLNFCNNVTKMIEEGYMEISDSIPVYNDSIQTLELDRCMEVNGKIIRRFKAVPKDLTAKEELQIIKDRLSELSDVLDFLLFSL